MPRVLPPPSVIRGGRSSSRGIYGSVLPCILAVPMIHHVPFAVHEGLAMFGVDRNNKAFVAARIVASWIGDDGKVKRRRRRSRRREFLRRARCGSLGEKPNINPLHLIKFCGLNRLFGIGFSGEILEVIYVRVLKFSSD